MTQLGSRVSGVTPPGERTELATGRVNALGGKVGPERAKTMGRRSGRFVRIVEQHEAEKRSVRVTADPLLRQPGQVPRGQVVVSKMVESLGQPKSEDRISEKSSRVKTLLP